MTDRTLRAVRFALWLLATAPLGCGQGVPEPKQARVPRPAAGDRVRPEVILGDAWRAGQLEQFNIQCRVCGPAGERPGLLLGADVPDAVLPRIAVTFFRGDEVLERVEDLQGSRFC